MSLMLWQERILRERGILDDGVYGHQLLTLKIHYVFTDNTSFDKTSALSRKIQDNEILDPRNPPLNYYKLYERPQFKITSKIPPKNNDSPSTCKHNFFHKSFFLYYLFSKEDDTHFIQFLCGRSLTSKKLPSASKNFWNFISICFFPFIITLMVLLLLLFPFTYSKKFNTL